MRPATFNSRVHAWVLSVKPKNINGDEGPPLKERVILPLAPLRVPLITQAIISSEKFP